MRGLGKYLFGGVLGAVFGFLISPKRGQQVREALLGGRPVVDVSRRLTRWTQDGVDYTREALPTPAAEAADEMLATAPANSAVETPTSPPAGPSAPPPLEIEFERPPHPPVPPAPAEEPFERGRPPRAEAVPQVAPEATPYLAPREEAGPPEEELLFPDTSGMEELAAPAAEGLQAGEGGLSGLEAPAAEGLQAGEQDVSEDREAPAQQSLSPARAEEVPEEVPVEPAAGEWSDEAGWEVPVAEVPDFDFAPIGSELDAGELENVEELTEPEPEQAAPEPEQAASELETEPEFEMVTEMYATAPETPAAPETPETHAVAPETPETYAAAPETPETYAAPETPETYAVAPEAYEAPETPEAVPEEPAAEPAEEPDYLAGSLDEEVPPPPATSAPGRVQAIAPADLKARIEETRRRIRRELDQPFAGPAGEEMIGPESPAAPEPVELEQGPGSQEGLEAEESGRNGGVPSPEAAPVSMMEPVISEMVAFQQPLDEQDADSSLELPVVDEQAPTAAEQALAATEEPPVVAEEAPVEAEPVPIAAEEAGAEALAPEAAIGEAETRMPEDAEPKTSAAEGAADGITVSDAAKPRVTVGEVTGFDHEAMRRRIEETRNRLKAKAFDAMMSGEGSLLRESRAEISESPSLAVDTELEESIETALSEEEF